MNPPGSSGHGMVPAVDMGLGAPSHRPDWRSRRHHRGAYLGPPGRSFLDRPRFYAQVRAQEGGGRPGGWTLQCEVGLARSTSPVRTAAFAYAVSPDGKRFLPLFRVIGVTRKKGSVQVESSGEWLTATLGWGEPAMTWAVEGNSAEALRIGGKALVVLVLSSERSRPQLRTALLDGRTPKPVRWLRHPLYAWRVRRFLRHGPPREPEGVRL
jgi:hypothetical protein